MLMMGFYDSAETEAAVSKLESAGYRRQGATGCQSGELVLSEQATTV